MTYQPTPVAPAKRAFLSKAVSDGRRLGLCTAYIKGASKRFNALGACWFAPRRMWVFRSPAKAERFIFDLSTTFSDAPTFDFDVTEKIDSALKHPEESFFAALLDVQILPLQSGGFAVSTVYDSYAVEAMRTLGGRFHKYASAWEVKRPLADITHAFAEYVGVDEQFLFIHERPVILEELVAPPKSEMPISVSGAAPVFENTNINEDESGSGFLSTLLAPLSKLAVDEKRLRKAAQEFGLYDYQLAGVRHLLGRSSALLADDMGLGKSRQAVVAASLAAGNDGRILVVCPASLRINWEREIGAVFPTDVVGMLGEDRMATLYGCRWAIANYERLGGLVREPQLQFAVMVIDEAHYLKEHEAGRTRHAFLMAERIERRFLLTGTPLLNREIEVHTLLRLSGHPLGTMPLADFRKQFAGGPAQRSALASHLSDWMLRRRKDVLKNLGTKTRQVRLVIPAEGLGAYEEIINNSSLTVMPKIVKLRQALEALKTDCLIELVQCLSPEDKVIIFCEYMNTVITLKEAFEAIKIGCVSLVGSDSGTKRQRAIDAFQQDQHTQVFIGTTSAAGVGITLTAANYVMFASLPWTPALMRQAEDRAYRNGQKRDVTVIVPLVPGTIDEQIYALLDSKTELEQEVVEVVRAHLDLH